MQAQGTCCILELLFLISSFVLHTCAEGDGVDKCAGDLLCRSLVPQREVISIKHTFLVLRCQKISEEAHAHTHNEAEVRSKGSDTSSTIIAHLTVKVMIRGLLSSSTH